MPYACRRCCTCCDAPPDMDSSELCARRSRFRIHGVDARARVCHSHGHGRSKLRIALDYCFKCFTMAFSHKKRDVHDRLHLIPSSSSSFPLPYSEPHGLASSAEFEAFKETQDSVVLRSLCGKAAAGCDIPDSVHVNACDKARSHIFDEGYDDSWRSFDNVASIGHHHHQRTHDEYQLHSKYSEETVLKHMESMGSQEAAASMPSSVVSLQNEEEREGRMFPYEVQESVDTEEEYNGASVSNQDDHRKEELEGNACEQLSFQACREDDIWSDEALISCQAKGFPPPISILANESHPGLPSNVQRTLWRSVKRGGRFVLQEVQACPDEFFQSTREHGRLRLQLVRSDSENLESFDNPPELEMNSIGTASSAVQFDTEAKHFAELTMEQTNIRASDQFPAKHTDNEAISLEESFTGGISKAISKGEEDNFVSCCQSLGGCGCDDDDNTFVGGGCQNLSSTEAEKSVAAPGMESDQFRSSNSSNMDVGMETGSILGHIENNICQMSGRASESSLQLSKNGSPMSQDHMINETKEMVGMSVVALHQEQTWKTDVVSVNKMATTPIGGADSEQFKQECQHVHFSSTYGFETTVTVNTLSPNQTFFQLPIQPVR